MNTNAPTRWNRRDRGREPGARTSSTRPAAAEDGVLILRRNRDAAAMAVATEILRIVFRYRRLRQTSDGYAANPCPSCLAPHLEYVKRFVLAGQPVHFVLPAFPGERSPFGSAAQVEKGLGQVEKELEEIGVS